MIEKFLATSPYTKATKVQNMQTQVQTSEGRDKILQRILNLRARAEDAGSSEAEMNTAFTMAMKLMDSYNIAEAELALAEAVS